VLVVERTTLDASLRRVTCPARPQASRLGFRQGDGAEALEVLIALSTERPTVIMCAEAVPWRCHRFLIADALVVCGFTVEHIMGPGVAKTHSLHPLAGVDEGLIRYPSP
jgi:hypothetical protein